MLSLVFDHFSPPRHVFVLLYTNTTNSSAIKAKIIQASIAGDDEKETVNFALIDAALITSSLHLQTAIHQALIADDQGALRTKTPHSEILWALNPTNNVLLTLNFFLVFTLSRSQRQSDDMESPMQQPHLLLYASRTRTRGRNMD